MIGLKENRIEHKVANTNIAYNCPPSVLLANRNLLSFNKAQAKDNFNHYEENKINSSSNSSSSSENKNRLSPRNNLKPLSPFKGSKSSKNVIPAQQGNPSSLKFKIEITPPTDTNNNCDQVPPSDNKNQMVPPNAGNGRRRKSVFITNVNNYEMDAYTPTSKYSVLSNSPLLSAQTSKRGNREGLSAEDELSQTKQGESSLQQIKDGKIKINVQMVLIDHFRYGQYTFDALCLFSSIPNRSLNPLYFERICLNLLVFTTHEDAITKCSNPLIMIAIGAELLIKISKLNPKIKYKAETVANELILLGENIQSSMKDEDMLNYYLKEQTDHNGRNALEIYAENKFYELLGDLSVGAIVGKLWFGSGHEQSIYKFFRLSRILMADIVREHYEPMVSNDYLPKNSVYSFQFYQFIKNCSVRNFFESMSIICITILYQFIIYAYVTFTKENVYHPSSHYYYTVEIITNILMYLSLLNYIFLLVYFVKTGRRLKINKTELIINVIMFIAVLCNFINLPQKICPVKENPDTNILLDGIIYSVIIAMGWMKVIVVLMTTNSYGPFIRIMFDVFWHVFVFLVIFTCITFLFAQCFTLFFVNSNVLFFEFYESFVTLFNTAFGQVFFDKFTDLDVFGFVALMLYSTLSNVILFNLIVAIINNLFNNLEEKADAENRAVLVLRHERIKWDDRYGLLILLPSPLNAFSLIFIPWLFIATDSLEEVNILFSKVCYFIVAIIIFIFLLLLGIVCYPFCIFKSLAHSTYDTWILNGKNKWRQIFLSFFTRPFILLYYFGADLGRFWGLIYEDSKEDEEKDGETNINIRNYIIALRKVLNDSRYKEKKKIIPIRELYSKLSLFKKKKKRYNKYSTSSIHAISKETSTSIPSPKVSGIIRPLKKSLDAVSSGSSNDEDTGSYDKQNATTGSGRHLISNNVLRHSNVFFDNEKKQKNILQEEMKFNFRKLIDKIVDPEGFIDIERTLLILPERTRYSKDFIQNLKFLNVRVFIRGLTKYLFLNAITNPVYSYKKLQLLMFKILLKFKMIYTYLPEAALLKINHDFTKIDENPLFEKTTEALQKYEDRDDVSEYDDEGEYVQDVSSKTTTEKMTIRSSFRMEQGTSSPTDSK